MLINFAHKGKWQQRLVKIISGDLCWILIVCGIFRMLYYSTLLVTQHNDSPAYLNYNRDIFRAQIDSFRTPVYPYFIKLISLFGKDNLLSNIVSVQCVISFLSVIAFFYTAKSVFATRRAILFSSLLYGLMIPVINFDTSIITESIAVSATVLLLSLIAGYLKKPKIWKAVFVSLFVFFLIMIRPSFIALLPVLIFFWIIRFRIYKNERKEFFFGLASSVMVILLIFCYAALNNRQNGYFGLSTVTTKNQLEILSHTNMYENGDDPEISQVIKDYLSHPETDARRFLFAQKIQTGFSRKRISNFITVNILNSPGKYFGRICGRAIYLGPRNIFTNYAKHKKTILSELVNKIEMLFFYVPFNFLYFFLGYSLFSIVKSRNKVKAFSLFELLLSLIIMMQLAVAIIGAPGEYQRLIVTTIPCLVILVFFYVERYWLLITEQKAKSL